MAKEPPGEDTPQGRVLVATCKTAGSRVMSMNALHRMPKSFDNEFSKPYMDRCLNVAVKQFVAHGSKFLDACVIEDLGDGVQHVRGGIYRLHRVPVGENPKAYLARWKVMISGEAK